MNPKLKRAYCHSNYPTWDLKFVTNAAQSRNNRTCLSDTQTVITNTESAAKVMKPRDPWDVIMRDVKSLLILGDCSCLNVESTATFAWKDWRQYQFQFWTKYIYNASLVQYNDSSLKKTQKTASNWGYNRGHMSNMVLNLCECTLWSSVRTRAGLLKLCVNFFLNHEFGNCIYAAFMIMYITHTPTFANRADLKAFFVQCKWN